MKKHRVRLRPKARKLRRSRFFAATLVLIMVAGGAFAVRKANFESWSLARVFHWPKRFYPHFTQVESLSISGVPGSLEQVFLHATGWQLGQNWGLLKPYRVAFKLKERYGCLRDIRVRRSWRSRSVNFQATLRVPVARAHGEKASYLDDSGVLFEAPEDIWAGAFFPEVDLSRFPNKGGLQELAHLLMAIAAPDGLPSPLKSLRFESPTEGWTGTLQDGTQLFWGNLQWTEQKLLRLKNTLSDAGTRFGKILSADLRSFEDGKILIRPR